MPFTPGHRSQVPGKPKFLSKLNQRTFESGMALARHAAWSRGRVGRSTGVSRARCCDWTALALDPTPIQMSIDPELAARGQNPHGIKACFGRTGRRRPLRENVLMHNDARTGSPLPRASALHHSFSSFSRQRLGSDRARVCRYCVHHTHDDAMTGSRPERSAHTYMQSTLRNDARTGSFFALS